MGTREGVEDENQCSGNRTYIRLGGIFTTDDVQDRDRWRTIISRYGWQIKLKADPEIYYDLKKF